MKKRMLSMLLCWALLFPFVATAGPFTDLFVFGDSLSDQGNVHHLTGGLVPPIEYTDGTNYGRFTNGLNYIDGLAASLGLNSLSSSAPGGVHNYAFGGARTDSQSVGGFPVPGALSILAQKDRFISDLVGGSADPNALFVVWAGANNLIDIVETAAGDPSYNPATASRQSRHRRRNYRRRSCRKWGQEYPGAKFTRFRCVAVSYGGLADHECRRTPQT